MNKPLAIYGQRMGFAALVGLLTPWTSPELKGEPLRDLSEPIAILQAVGSEGSGNERARNAVQQLEAADASALLPLLEAMDEANGLGLNWLRATADSLVDRELAAKRPLPVGDLGAFLLDGNHHPRARRYAYELVQRITPDAAEQMLPGLLHDASVEIRRDAVQRLVDQGEELETAGRTAEASLVWQQALGAARDVDQIETVAGGLERLGRDVDLPKHFGFLTHWQVIGPFDNTGRAGFAATFPPESELDFKASYDGKGQAAAWQELVTSDTFGMLDVNQAFGPLKEVTAYAYTEFESERDQRVELRLGCKNAWKVWLNGEFLFGRDEYHRGMRIDQYRMEGQLRAGKNTILVKLCQNEQTERWTVEWQFQLRVCDETGTAILAANRMPTPKPETKTRR